MLRVRDTFDIVGEGHATLASGLLAIVAKYTVRVLLYTGATLTGVKRFLER